MVTLVALELESQSLSVEIPGAVCWRYTNDTGHYVCPPDTINPLSFAFLFFYLILITFQFIGMLIHRWSSIVIYLAEVDLWRHTQSVGANARMSQIGSTGFWGRTESVQLICAPRRCFALLRVVLSSLSPMPEEKFAQNIVKYFERHVEVK